MGKKTKKQEPPQERRQSKRVKAGKTTTSSIPSILYVDKQTCQVSVPTELAWITADLGETDPLLVFSFVPEALDALVAELQRVFPGGAAPQVFTTHPFTASSVQRNILDYMADITPGAVANHTQVHGCMIGPNTGPEFARVNCRSESFQVAVLGLGLNGNNLQLPIARPYGIFEGRATMLLEGVAVGSGGLGAFIG